MLPKNQLCDNIKMFDILEYWKRKWKPGCINILREVVWYFRFFKFMVLEHMNPRDNLIKWITLIYTSQKANGELTKPCEIKKIILLTLLLFILIIKVVNRDISQDKRIMGLKKKLIS